MIEILFSDSYCVFLLAGIVWIWFLIEAKHLFAVFKGSDGSLS